MKEFAGIVPEELADSVRPLGRASVPTAETHGPTRAQEVPRVDSEARPVRPRASAASRDMLRDGIYELRGREGRMNYRILYFFHGKAIAILAQGLTKEKEVPASDIERAIERKKRYEQDPERHRAKLRVPQEPDDL